LFLQQIMQARRDADRLERGRRAHQELRAASARQSPPRPFLAALRDAHVRDGVALIAEIKRASPSKGLLRGGLQPGPTARLYEACGAAAVSVLTEERWFQGSLDDLREARAATSLPILRKDFLSEEWEIWEARAAGADAVLLIAAALEPDRLRALAEEARSAGMDALIEVHDGDELRAALETSPTLIGINNRNLATFQVTLDTTEQLAPRVPKGIFLVSESGIADGGDVRRVLNAGAHAILVGESLVKDADPTARIHELLGRSQAREEMA